MSSLPLYTILYGSIERRATRPMAGMRTSEGVMGPFWSNADSPHPHFGRDGVAKSLLQSRLDHSARRLASELYASVTLRNSTAMAFVQLRMCAVSGRADEFKTSNISERLVQAMQGT